MLQKRHEEIRFFFFKNLLYRSEGYRGKFKSFKDKDLQGCITSSRPETDSTKYCVFLYVCDIHSPLSLSPIPPLSTYRRANHSLWSTTCCHHGLSSVIGHRPGSTQKGISITSFMGTLKNEHGVVRSAKPHWNRFPPICTTVPS